MSNFVEPFLRWAGGKRWLTSRLAPILQGRVKKCYYEPFLGSGAMFLAVSPSKAYLSDLNADLINAFVNVKNLPDELVYAIKSLPVDKDNYYRIRNSQPTCEFQRAVRFIYLNRTCYGGIYRENRQGKFNVPYGGGSRTPEPLWTRNLIRLCSKAIKNSNSEFSVLDFENSLNLAGDGDVVFCDPTYRSVTRNQFDRYGAVVFDWHDQERLAIAAERACRRGALVVISNTYCEEVLGLYRKSFRIMLQKVKSIGNITKDPNKNKECLIILDPQKKRSVWSKLGKIERIPRDNFYLPTGSDESLSKISDKNQNIAFV